MATFRVSTLAVGDEVLRGEIINSNAAWLSEQLLALGAILKQHTIVGDTPTAIQVAVNELLEHSDILIITGGLGPTDDDLTIESLAKGRGTTLVEDSAALRNLTQRFATLNKPMPIKNIKQALLPLGSQALQNPIGTAPGMWWVLPQQGNVIIALPGVPKEMKALWPQVEANICKWLHSKGIQPTPIATRDLWLYGIGESQLMEALEKPTVQRVSGTQPSVASYVSHDGRVRLCLSLPHTTPPEEVQGLFDAFMELLPERLKPYVLDEPFTQLAPNVMHYLNQFNLQLAMAESCTGGGLSHAFIQHAGASAFISANVVSYSNSAKERILGVPEHMIEAHGAVSEQVAIAMAHGVRNLSDNPSTCIGLATTGIAGPEGGSTEKPVGNLWVGVSLPDGSHLSKHIQVNSAWDRASIQERFINSACLFLLNLLRSSAMPAPTTTELNEPAQL
jgi:nicotinamide-nucleotide amidase